ncbi:NADP-dependent malic enzyme [Candidatus Micrarchaeota archaeon]|nr:NADP-dependent malic enzyme [Candidatus Micrarchaeota archaeon]
MISEVDKRALALHKRLRGKIGIHVKGSLDSQDDLKLMYTPGVAAVSKRVAEDADSVHDLTWKSNSVAVVSDGSRVLGLGDIGPLGAMPVMEGKAALYNRFAAIDAVPICTNTRTAAELISVVRAISPSFGGINLEDIDSPKCFEVDATLARSLDIPVFHDDQHGTAVVTLAAIHNSLLLTGRKLPESSFVVNGAGAAGVAITKLLLTAGANHIVCLDSKGIISQNRKLAPEKQKIAKLTGVHDTGTLDDAMKGADVFIGVSAPNAVTGKQVRSMSPQPVILALANPVPEISPDKALRSGAAIVGTGSSLYDNQVNNVSSFPGIMRGLLDTRAKRLNNEIKLAAARAIAGCITPSRRMIIPKPTDDRVCPAVARAVAKASAASGVARVRMRNLNEYETAVRERVRRNRQKV